MASRVSLCAVRAVWPKTQMGRRTARACPRGLHLRRHRRRFRSLGAIAAPLLRAIAAAGIVLVLIGGSPAGPLGESTSRQGCGAGIMHLNNCCQCSQCSAASFHACACVGASFHASGLSRSTAAAHSTHRVRCTSTHRHSHSLIPPQQHPCWAAGIAAGAVAVGGRPPLAKRA
jgi:hypothetical protein